MALTQIKTDAEITIAEDFSKCTSYINTNNYLGGEKSRDARLKAILSKHKLTIVNLKDAGSPEHIQDIIEGTKTFVKIYTGRDN